jgi:hypothetical protein
MEQTSGRFLDRLASVVAYAAAHLDDQIAPDLVTWAKQRLAATEPPDDEPAPPFDPDPDLIDHLEGNRRERRRYQDYARRMRDESDDPGRA